MPHALTLTLATWNVNSLRARLPNLLAWLDKNPVDMLLLQELKCTEDHFPRLELEERGYNLAISGQKTFNGVAICSKYPLEDVSRSLPGDASDMAARYIEAVVSLKDKALRVASVYVPNGQEAGSDKFAYKLAFLERLQSHWHQLLTYDEIAVLGGDFNVAPYPMDVYDPEKLDGSVCYHPEERTRMRALMHLGLMDAFRLKHPEAREYSWWDYRSGGYQRGHGMRIDHLLLSPEAADHLTDAAIDERPRGEEKPSDHAPVTATLEL